MATVVTGADDAGMESGRVASAAPCGSDLRGRFLEGVGDRFVKAQCGAFMERGIPSNAAGTSTDGIEEGRVQPRVHGVLGVAESVSRRGADKARRATDIAVDDGDPGEASERFVSDRRDDKLATELQLLAERLASGVCLTAEQ